MLTNILIQAPWYILMGNAQYCQAHCYEQQFKSVYFFLSHARLVLIFFLDENPEIKETLRLVPEEFPTQLQEGFVLGGAGGISQPRALPPTGSTSTQLAQEHIGEDSAPTTSILKKHLPCMI